tara:strand:+ start:109 stop:465 length:357 start_codon:yes stop_codon:yes gene_type:complete
MPTTLSSTFDLINDDGLAINGVATINMPAIGRGTIAVVGFTATGANNAVLTLTKSGGGTVGVATLVNTNNPCADAVIDNGQVVVTGGESLIATATTAAITRFVITCQAVGTTVATVIT